MQNHTRFIIGCITWLATFALGAGAYLLLKGFQSGELLAQMAGMGMSGLVGFLGGKMAERNANLLSAPGQPIIQNQPTNELPKPDQ